MKDRSRAAFFLNEKIAPSPFVRELSVVYKKKGTKRRKKKDKPN